MTGEKCRHCGGRIEYVLLSGPGSYDAEWWQHVPPVPTWPAHHAAPAFGGGS